MPLIEPAGVYRPRHPERTVACRLFDEHFERYVREYEERYEAREGPLREVVTTAVEAYLACGRLEGGFARIRCPSCRAEHLLAFSCRTRNFCPSCQAKRSALFAEHVVTEILEPVPHRHVVLTIPRVLRGLFQRERRLLGVLARSARDAIVPSVRAILDRKDVTPGLVVSIPTFGSYDFHPHVHALLTDGACNKESSLRSRTSTRGSSRRSSAAACSSACTAPSGCRRSSSTPCSAGSTRDSRCTGSRRAKASRAT